MGQESALWRQEGKPSKSQSRDAQSSHEASRIFHRSVKILVEGGARPRRSWEQGGGMRPLQSTPLSSQNTQLSASYFVTLASYLSLHFLTCKTGLLREIGK